MSHYALPHQGGIELVVEQLWQRLAEKGHKVTHLCSAIDSPLDEQEYDNRIRVRIPALNFLERSAIPFPIFNPLILWSKLNEILKTVDVVNVQGMLYMDCVIAAWMARQHGIPVVITEYPGFVKYKNKLVNLFERLAFHTLGRFCCRQANAAVIINWQVANNWVKPFLRHDVLVLKIDIGVDIDSFKPAGADEKLRLRDKFHLVKPTVLFVGRLVYRKGIDLLERIADKQFDLVICGRGLFESDHPNIRVLGEVSQTELLELYRAVDIFVLMTDGQDFPLVGLEAISSGLPIVVFDTEANHEYLNETCAVFTDQSSFKDDIVILLGDNRRRSEMSAAARAWAVNHFSWQQVTEKYLQLFYELQNSA